MAFSGVLFKPSIVGLNGSANGGSGNFDFNQLSKIIADLVKQAGELAKLFGKGKGGGGGTGGGTGGGGGGKNGNGSSVSNNAWIWAVLAFLGAAVLFKK